MVTLKAIEKKYGMPIKRSFKRDIEKYINDVYIQDILAKAMRYDLTDKEIDRIFEIGKHNSKQYPHLYYLATIYIHPLTYGQAILRHAKKLGL